MTQQVTQHISVKGVRDGLLITFGPGEYGTLLEDLSAELAAKHGFLEGSKVTVSIGRRSLERSELMLLQTVLAEHGMVLWAILSDSEESKEVARGLGLATRLPGSNTDLNGNVLQTAALVEQPTSSSNTGVEGSNGLILRETIRSGRSVYHEGHVVVIGDVNPGAEIIAGGDVVVWGKLRGLVHAGALGDTTAVICALELIPTQLRIADQIAISPHDQRRQLTPEKVSIHNGQIVAEAWQ
ncbi:MAG: septum site-determining protein MinC [Candidatus Promineifilaceae bacterium]